VAILLVVALLAGVVTGLSPCVLPVVPVFAAGGAMGGSRWRPVGIIAGMVLTFSIVTLAGSSLLSFLGLPQDFLRDLGIAVLFVLGASLIFPQLGYLIEKPFARLAPQHETRSRNGILLGAGLGLVFVPCAGPVLAAVTVVSATHKVGLQAIVVTICYALGAAVPLLVVAYLSRRAMSRVRSLRRGAPRLRQAAGVLIVASAAVILFGSLQSLQTDLPGYATALDSRIEGSGSVAAKLRKLSGEHTLGLAKDGQGLPDRSNPVLTDYGTAPRLLKLSPWLNTPGGRPLSLGALKGKVVLVDFWTYSCINCERTIPHLEAWYRRYSPYGLVIIGVHTPEFPFERAPGNVRRAVKSLGITYPVGIDDTFLTWLTYGTTQWPTEYLIDQAGQLRYVEAGEGNYSETESLIRDLLAATNSWLPPPTDVLNRTPTETTTPEIYLGSFGLQFNAGPTVIYGKTATYTFPLEIPLDYIAFQGTWANNGNAAISRARAALRLYFQAKDVYMVLGGQGKIHLLLDGRPLATLEVSGYPKNYTLITGSTFRKGLLQLELPPGISAYDFTFG